MINWDCILLRYGEIGLKSKRTRHHFEKEYVLAIKEALKRKGVEDHTVSNLGGRFVIYTTKVKEAIAILSQVPGIQSLSPAVKIQFEKKENFLKSISELFKKELMGKTFYVRVKRVGEHDFTSLELAKEIADNLYHLSKGVQLNNPDFWINVEVRNKEAFVYNETVEGIGGLPPNPEDRVLCLFSGGMDSPVAAYQIMKRGCAVDFLFINLQGEKSLEDASRVYDFLINEYAFGYIPKFYEVNGKELIKKIKKDIPDRERQVFLKVIFYKIGEALLRKGKYVALVTGESLSQKSSQTPQSLAVIDNSISCLTLRPLIGMDKLEITRIAKKLGTFAASEKVKEYCKLAEGPVLTSPKYSVLKQASSFEEEINKAVSSAKISKGLVELEATTELIEEAKAEDLKGRGVIDLRTDKVRKEFSLKADLVKEYPDILEEISKLDSGKKYLVICSFGVRSDEVAFMLKKRGIDAISLRYEEYKKIIEK
jgi:thiamine biosynthesis protein ThiI